MIGALRRLFEHAGRDPGNASCAALGVPSGACVDGDASLPPTDDGATPTTPVDLEIELMRYLLLSMAAAY
ncbi:hypothetical protein [Paraburkholderia guartelaensis]|uniref:hypothetical protein n=1 Tax=Paraburkholderia guartelaensis TaxID=2546446 RepID=UPI002AB6D53E|nr:hypothetical protein [Paraburkholderia guartelaensis]